MSERSEYTPGEFCWVDLAVPDPEAAASFYRDLLGWEWEAGGEEAGGYGIFTRDGKVVAGMGPRRSEEQPTVWASYVSVADADASAAQVRDAGGGVLAEPFDVLDAGRMAVCQDPQGAVFCVWQPGQTYGAQLVNEVGAWTWNQLATTDVQAAERFYSQVFGWSLAKPELAPPDGQYFNWQLDGQRWDEGIGGAMPIEGNLPQGSPPFWIVNLAVESAGGAIETTKGAGGNALTDVVETPVGTLAALMDPQGAVFAIIEPDYPEER